MENGCSESKGSRVASGQHSIMEISQEFTETAVQGVAIFFSVPPDCFDISILRIIMPY